jgi:hypothetical protein
LAEGVAIAREAPLPEAVAKDDDERSAELFLLRGECSTKDGCTPQHLEKFDGDAVAAKTFRLGPTGEV